MKNEQSVGEFLNSCIRILAYSKPKVLDSIEERDV